MLLKPQILHLPENDATKHCTAELQSQCVGGELLAGWRQVWLNWFKTRDLLRISFQKYSTVSNWKPLETQTSSFLPPISENRRIPYTKINIVIMIQLQLLKRSHNNKKEDKKLGKKNGTNTSVMSTNKHFQKTLVLRSSTPLTFIQTFVTTSKKASGASGFVWQPPPQP